MMYIIGVLCMVGLTATLPVLPEPPKLPYSIAAALQGQVMHTNIPEQETVFSPVEDSNKDVKENFIKIYPVFIPPPPELPPFDYSILSKEKAQKARSDGSVESEAERSVEVKDMKPIEKPFEEEAESKPVENNKSEEKDQPMEESKSEEQPISVEEPIYVEEPKSVDEPIYLEEPTIVKEPKSEEGPIIVEENKSIEDPKSAEKPQFIEDPKPVEHLDSKGKPKEEPEKPLEDIPVVIQFSIPTTSFFSNLISKFPSLPSFGLGWPFHIPSIFKRIIDPEFSVDDEIYPY